MALAIAPASALAQPAPPASEALVLQGDIERYAADTEGSDCTTACRALDSMRRATDRICEIEPGDGCARAEATLRRTAARVRAACPECAATRDNKAPAGTVAVTPNAPAPPPPAAEYAAVERKQGGCSGCTTSGQSDAPPFFVVLAAVAGWAIRRRRRMKR
jgi:MYXO-CTERM domain-containing protein